MDIKNKLSGLHFIEFFLHFNLVNKKEYMARFRKILKFSLSYESYFLWIIMLIAISCDQQSYNNLSNDLGKDYFTEKPKKTDFTLAIPNDSATILLDRNDDTGVLIAASLFQNDLHNLAGHRPHIIYDNLPTISKSLVIIGTIEGNEWIKQLIASNKIQTEDIQNKWESCLIQVVTDPFPGIKSALIIAGSDKRGTIYGMFDITQKAGVSPWYWWADVPIPRKETLYIKNNRYLIKEPKVKYRGIFLNDEDPALSGWAKEKFGGFNHLFYDKVFELILRLKGNYLWPAMWGSAFYDDDPLNGKLADKYGIVIGTSHHEPLGRAHDEWRRYGKGTWDYSKNGAVLRDFWKGGMERMADYEKIVTIGMRGDGDMGMSDQTNTALLERIVNDQRQIINKVTGQPAEKTPQLWALYKEVQDYYDKGMRVPDDVTLLFCDDNWGNIRKLPDLDAAGRKGGYGMYYHFDFVGGPRNYKWINTSPIPRIYEQLHLCYEYGVNQIWIVNVGDLKPMELPISFFFDYARNPGEWNPDRIKNYPLMWAQQQFGNDYANDIGSILNTYTKYNGRRTPELLDDQTFSLNHYREFEKVTDAYQQLADKNNEIHKKLPYSYQNAYYQLAYYPVEAMANLYQMYYALALNKKYAKERRTSTNIEADKVDSLFMVDQSLSDYYHFEISEGKWNHMMSQPHIGYTSWQQPESNIKPEVIRINIPEKAEMGIETEGDTLNLSLPEFDAFNKQKFYVEIFNTGQETFKYTIMPSEKWINLSSKEGSVNLQKRIFIDIDWKHLQKGETHTGNITITSSCGQNFKVNVQAFYPDVKIANHTFLEKNRYVSINANNYNSSSENDTIHWQVISDLSRTGSGITTFPVTYSLKQFTADNPHLNYNFFFLHKPTQAESEVTLYFAPTQNFKKGTGLHFALSMDNNNPLIVNLNEGMNIPDWQYPDWFNQAVSHKTMIKKVKLKIENEGIHQLKYYMIDGGIVLQKIVIDNGGVKSSYLGPPESIKTN